MKIDFQTLNMIFIIMPGYFGAETTPGFRLCQSNEGDKSIDNKMIDKKSMMQEIEKRELPYSSTEKNI